MEKQKNSSTEHGRSVPELRFTEFEDGWDKKRYGDVFSFRTTNSYSRENLNYFEGKVKNIHYGDIHTKFKTLFDIEKESIPFINSQINLNGITNDNYCQEGDLIIADASEDYADVGKCIEIVNLNNEKVLAGLHTILARPDLHKMSIGFNGYLMKSEKVRLQIKIIAQGTKVLSISTGRLSNLNLNIPSIPEQQKIASFLTVVDDKLQALKKKKELLEQYKKGVIQKIFSQEIRFKSSSAFDSSAFDSAQASDSSLIERKEIPLIERKEIPLIERSRNQQAKDFPEWEKKKLGDLTYKVGKKNKDNVKYPIYSINNKEGFLPQSDQFEGMDSNDRGYDISMYKIIEENTFAYNPARINVGSIGYSGLLNNVIISSLYVCFKTTELLEDYFLLQYLKSYKFNKSVLRNVEGGVRDYLFYESFSKIKIHLPSNKEQIRITNFLSAIDKKINHCQMQIVKTEQWKKGILQKMFV